MAKINPDDVVHVVIFKVSGSIRYIVKKDGLYVAYNEHGQFRNSSKRLGIYLDPDKGYINTKKLKRSGLSDIIIDEDDILLKTKDWVWVR